ncbi:hypothetical protein DY000_02035418 [Brassica cretica]|uniref:F-box associated beta-propeller type 1 domain-containing protein n=1 Tax=Brassica cretica TaxID=69181 RepID=A0ABQ7DW83_BRACR|nr:hypothetical protein DY000_02035418 [Brassica cretica]
MSVRIPLFSCSGQTRWIKPRISFGSSDRFALGHDNNNINHKILKIYEAIHPVTSFFVCFDFTAESFGPLLPLPPHSYHGLHFVSFSCVRQEQLAVLYHDWQARETIEISVTDKIVLMLSFLIDEKRKLALVFVIERDMACWYQTAHVIGQEGYFKSARIREAPDLGKPCYPHERYCAPLLCSSYLPSLVQLNQPG